MLKNLDLLKRNVTEIGVFNKSIKSDRFKKYLIDVLLQSDFISMTRITDSKMFCAIEHCLVNLVTLSKYSERRLM